MALSVTQAAHLSHVQTLCRALGDLDPRPYVMVGGQATPGLPAAAFGADLVTTDLAAGLDFAASVAEPAPPPSLAAYLAAVGRRVQAGRLAAGLTQAALAERSGLTASHGDSTAWMDAADRPAVVAPPEGFVLVDRTQRRTAPHPFRHRNGERL